jgi:hypothetical protein
MPLKDFITGRTNKIKIAGVGVGLIISAATYLTYVRPALLIENPDGERLLEISDHGAIGVGSGATAFGNAGDCLKSGGSSGNLMAYGTCGSGGAAGLVDHYVLASGDTMTGALTINVQGGNANTVGLKVVNTASGRHLHAEQLLSSSGAIIQQNGPVIFDAIDVAGNPSTFVPSGNQYRFMWHPEKVALRAGEGTFGVWDDANIGYGSAAFGEDNLASGEDSFAAGFENEATGDLSFAAGSKCHATGYQSFCFGAGNTSTASGAGAIAMGSLANAWGLGTVAIGVEANAKPIDNNFDNYMTVIGGDANLATRYNATVIGGFSNTASGQITLVAGGESNIAWNNYAVAMGQSAIAKGEHSFAAGHFVQTNAANTYMFGHGLSALNSPVNDVANSFEVSYNNRHVLSVQTGSLVGINKNNPKANLDVLGSISGTSLLINGDSKFNMRSTTLSGVTIKGIAGQVAPSLAIKLSDNRTAFQVNSDGFLRINNPINGTPISTDTQVGGGLTTPIFELKNFGDPRIRVDAYGGLYLGDSSSANFPTTLGQSGNNYASLNFPINLGDKIYLYNGSPANPESRWGFGITNWQFNMFMDAGNPGVGNFAWVRTPTTAGTVASSGDPAMKLYTTGEMREYLQFPTTKGFQVRVSDNHQTANTFEIQSGSTIFSSFNSGGWLSLNRSATPKTPLEVNGTVSGSVLRANDYLRLNPRASAPANPQSGDMYMDSSPAPDELCTYDGSTWQAIISGTDANCT